MPEEKSNPSISFGSVENSAFSVTGNTTVYGGINIGTSNNSKGLEDVLKMMATLRGLSHSLVEQVPEPQREQAQKEAKKIEAAITEIETEAKKAPEESQVTTAEWLEERVKNLVAPVTAISLMVVPATEAIEAASENILNTSTNVTETVDNFQGFATKLQQITGASAEVVEFSKTVGQYAESFSPIPKLLESPSQ